MDDQPADAHDDPETVDAVAEDRAEDVFEAGFNAANGLLEFASLSYPDLAVTPFAVYRD